MIKIIEVPLTAVPGNEKREKRVEVLTRMAGTKMQRRRRAIAGHIGNRYLITLIVLLVAAAKCKQ